MTNQKHQNGYLPKIAYHMAGNCPASVEYFTERQMVTYGPITPEQMLWICKEVASIHRTWKIEEKEFNSHLSINQF